jgi:hypothetical protein
MEMEQTNRFPSSHSIVLRSIPPLPYIVNTIAGIERERIIFFISNSKQKCICDKRKWERQKKK